MNNLGVIFDLDGTLLDTLQDLASSVNAALLTCHYPTRTLFEIRNFVGNGVAKLIERAVPPNLTKEEYEHCLSLFRTHYMQHMYDTTKPYDGILSLLSALNADGYRLAVVSNKLDAAVCKLNELFFKDYISTAIGTPPDAKKPNPSCVFTAAKKLHVPLSSCIYVGDSEVDIQTARNAGIPCIGVAWGFRGRSHLEQHHADYIVDSPSELKELLSKLGRIYS